MKILLPVIVLAFAAPAALADEVELTSGAVIEGKVIDQGDSIKVVRSGSSIVYPKYMVRKITPKKTIEEIYDERAKALKDTDLDGHLALARWCSQQKLAKEAVVEFKKAVAINPDHEEARKGAGYVRVGDAWMTEDEANEAKGLVRFKGRWMTPEEKNLEVALEEQKELDQQLLREVQSCLERVHSTDDKKRQDAIARLAKIDDKQKAKPFLAAITSTYRATRRYVYEELARMKEGAAAKPLCRRALWDEDENLRTVAAKALVEINHPDTALYLAPFLGEESVSARTRCAELMAGFKDLRAAPVLVEALANCLARIKQQEDLQGQDESTAVVNRTVILSDGTRVTLPKVVRVKSDARDKEHLSKLQIEKAAIVTTLRAVTGQDIADDVGKWRSWLLKNNGK